MNSSRLRSVSAAPKLAITMMMTVLLRSRSRPNSNASTQQREPAGQRDGDDRGDRQRPAERERPDRREQRRRICAPSALATASAK